MTGAPRVSVPLNSYSRWRLRRLGCAAAAAASAKVPSGRGSSCAAPTSLLPAVRRATSATKLLLGESPLMPLTPTGRTATLYVPAAGITMVCTLRAWSAVKVTVRTSVLLLGGPLKTRTRYCVTLGGLLKVAIRVVLIRTFMASCGGGTGGAALESEGWWVHTGRRSCAAA